MEVRSLGYRTDLALRAASGSRIEDRGDHLVVRTPGNPHFWWGNFILVERVPAGAEGQVWLDVFGEAFPDAEHVAIGFDGTDGSLSDLSWYTGEGYQAEASAVMTAGRVHPPRTLNSEATCRVLESDDDWEQSVQMRIRCNDRLPNDAGYEDFVRRKSESHRELVGAGRAAWFGAFIEGRLASQMGLVAVGGGLARFQSVETDPDFRRLGLAGTLVHHAGRFGFAEFAACTLVIVADPGYHAIDLYRSVGFAETETQLQIERPVTP